MASNWSVRTIFLAETKDDKVFDVTVYRNGTQKNQKFISAGDPKMQTTMNVAKSTNDIDVVAEIIRRDNPGAHKISCTYTAKAKSWSDGDHTWMDTTWLPGEPVCENIKEICHDCKISCNKSYDPDQYRWETVFTISD